MKRVCVMALLVFVSGHAAAQEKPTPEQIEAMVEKTLPGPQHEELAALEGRWAQEITYDMGAGKPAHARGVATNRMILGGRFLVSEGSAKAPFGMSDVNHEVMRIYGFDRRTSQYTVIELDTLGTYWVAAAGSRADGRGIVMSGESLDDHGGAREMRRYDMVLRVVDPDTYVTEIVFKFPNRPDLKVVEAVHRRIK